MKIMKKLFALLLVACMALSLCACGGNSNKKDEEQNDNKVNNEVSDDQAADDSDEDDSKQEQASFKVKVVDQNGDPVQGVMVQVCKEFCLPAFSDADGIATISIEIEEGHKLQFSSAPEGYTYEGETDIYLEAGQTEYTMELKKAE